MTSTYDQLHDQYSKTATPKKGVRYERLTAFVLKSLNKSDRVIHDIKLRGKSSVKHQIDVTIEENQAKKRVLIECKDFDTSLKKVGLGIIRDFSAVVEDVKPDESIVITCIGYTRDAIKFAKHKGIKLAILRKFQPNDWKGGIKGASIKMNNSNTTEPVISLGIKNPEDIEKILNYINYLGISSFEISRNHPVYLNIDNKKIHYIDFCEQKFNEYPTNKPGPVNLKIPLNNAKLEIDSLDAIQIEGIKIDFEVIDRDMSFEVISNPIAQIILEGFNGRDIIIFDMDLKKLSINQKTGEVYA